MADDSEVYADKLAEFVALGAKLITTDPVTRYGSIAFGSTRRLEPGFIPTAGPPSITLISPYPNASTLDDVEYVEMDRRSLRWGETALVAIMKPYTRTGYER